MKTRNTLLGVLVAFALVIVGGGVTVDNAAATKTINVRGKGPGAARLACPGGMTNMGYELSEFQSVFGFDPQTHLNDVYTASTDGYEVERVTMSSHVGTHLDVPRHFIAGARGLTDLEPQEFVWPAYKIDVSEIELEPGQLQLTKKNIRDYERQYGNIKRGSLVVLDTSITSEFYLDDAGDARVTEGGDLANNTDDLFSFQNEGFSEEAINWMFEKRSIAGVGSDAYGPDAADDVAAFTYSATYATLLNGGVALVALDNVESLNVTGDIIIAPTVRLTEGSGFPTNPIACHGQGW